MSAFHTGDSDQVDMLGWAKEGLTEVRLPNFLAAADPFLGDDFLGEAFFGGMVSRQADAGRLA